MSSSSSLSSYSHRLPVWAQLGIALALFALIYMILASSAYVSVWDEEDSNFYESAKLGLQMRGLSPSAPTAFVFWEKGCEDCESSIRALQMAPSQVRIYGVHLSNSDLPEHEIRSEWLKLAPAASVLLIDKDQFLQTNFRVRSIPMAFLYFPKHKKIFSYLGDISRNLEDMNEVVSSHSAGR